jgi:hypothetical protein
MLMVTISLAGCGSDTSSGTSSTPATASQTGTITRPTTSVAAPTISGVPTTAAAAGQPYSFQPTATTAAGTTARFAIANKPSWAKFDTATGQLSGTPTSSQVGKYAGVAISVTDGTKSASLPAFTITVNTAAAAAVSGVTLSWQPPTENADGTALLNLQGYTLHYGTTSQSYSSSIKIANPGLTTYVVQNLTPGTYYFAIDAYNSSGVESALSGEVSTMVN